MNEKDAHTLTEASLLRLARSGDEQAFAQLVQSYAGRLYRVVQRIAGDALEAEAIVQEAFFRAWQALPRYRVERPFFPYLVTIALNLGRDQWRKQRFLDFSDLEELAELLPDAEPSPETWVESREALQALAAAVEALPQAYRAVIALRYDAGMSYEEIAKALRLPVNTIRTHLRRAKERLRMALKEQSHE